MSDRKLRARVANMAIRVIGQEGPRFLFDPSNDRYGQLAVDRYTQVWYIDHFTGMMLYPFEGHAWKGFYGTEDLKAIVMALALYVHDDIAVDLALIERTCATPYGAMWPEIRARLLTLAVIAPPKKKTTKTAPTP